MHRLIVRETAQRQMERLPKHVYESVKERISNLRHDPRPHGAKKLTKDFGWSIRVGNYRVIYRIDDKEQVVFIAAVKPRQSAYRRKS